MVHEIDQELLIEFLNKCYDFWLDKIICQESIFRAYTVWIQYETEIREKKFEIWHKKGEGLVEGCFLNLPTGVYSLVSRKHTTLGDVTVLYWDKINQTWRLR